MTRAQSMLDSYPNDPATISTADPTEPRQPQPSGPPSEDPQVRRMLASHMHCGEPMQLVAADPVPSSDGSTELVDGGPATYRCACGFSFDRT